MLVSSAYASPDLVPLPTLGTQRAEISFSQAELAAATGTSASTIRRLECGGRTTPQVVARLNAFFDEERARQQAWCEEFAEERARQQGRVEE